MKYDIENLKVLIVDDEPDIRSVLSRILNLENISNKVVANGSEALDLLRREEFCTVICDIMMPEMSGMDCLAQAQSEGIQTPFVFVTGFGDSRRMLQAVRLGAMDFISKPFDNHEIVSVVYRSIEVGKRKSHIARKIAETDLKLSHLVDKEEKFISMMRVTNNRYRD